LIISEPFWGEGKIAVVCRRARDRLCTYRDFAMDCSVHLSTRRREITTREKNGTRS
jgi:hypothetical protein